MKDFFRIILTFILYYSIFVFSTVSNVKLDGLSWSQTLAATCTTSSTNNFICFVGFRRGEKFPCTHDLLLRERLIS
jgi:hypothetical protein